MSMFNARRSREVTGTKLRRERNFRTRWELCKDRINAHGRVQLTRVISDVRPLNATLN